jgi:hypothetical protein
MNCSRACYFMRLNAAIASLFEHAVKNTTGEHGVYWMSDTVILLEPRRFQTTLGISTAKLLKMMNRYRYHVSVPYELFSSVVVYNKVNELKWENERFGVRCISHPFLFKDNCRDLVIKIAASAENALKSKNH